MPLLGGKRALVIGAGSGIGAATARLYAADGARLACADLNPERVKETAQAVGGPAYPLDITDADAVRATVDAAAQALGGLDIVVNTPFFASAHPDVENLSPEQFRREWEVLAGGTLYTFRAAIPHLRRAGGGVLLTTSSGLFGDYGAFAHPAIIPAYGMAKGAQEILTKTTAMLHARDGIRVCAVQPGFTLTEGARISMQRQGVTLEQFTALAGAGMPSGAGAPEAVAEGFAFLASEYASYITGFTLLVDGGSYASHFGRMLP